VIMLIGNFLNVGVAYLFIELFVGLNIF